MDLLTPNQQIPNQNQAPDKNRVMLGFLISLSVICLVLLFVIGIILKKDKPSNPNSIVINSGEVTTLEEKIAKQGELNKFISIDEVQTYLENNTSQQNNYYALDTIASRSISPEVDFGTSALTAVGLGSSEEKNVADGRGGGGGYSTTNIQVAGVDEADIIKTDGDYIYLISGQKIYIIDAVPAGEANILTEIELESRAQNLYINKNKLIAYGYNNNVFSNDRFNFIIPKATYTYFNVYDISDKSNPKLERELNFEGNYINSRMVGDYVYFLTSKYPNVFAEDIMPRVIDGETLLCADNNLDSKKCPSIYYFNIPNSSYQMTTVAAINVQNSDKEITRDIYLLGGSNNIYVSTKALYITNTKYLNEYQLAMEVTLEIVEPKLSDNLKKKLAKIRLADPDVLNKQEKLQKITQVVQYYLATLSGEEQIGISEEVQNRIKQKYKNLEAELEQTIIHKISIDQDKMKSMAEGNVPGTVLNQFSMDENDGYFRIATTRNRRWSQLLDDNQEAYNNMYVLDDNLKIVGRLEHLAQTERIYSVRFMQDRAYMVTFQQVDPLFVIDLSSPTDPKVLGELKIPGFSNYLHPYDNDTLIGLGQDTTTNEWGGVRNQGVKLSLFDVADVTNPKEIDNYIFSEPNSSSIAQHDHKAFLFSSDKNLLVIPVSAWNNQNMTKNYNAAMVFRVDKNGFEFRGKIDHSHQTCPAKECGMDTYQYDSGVQVLRSLFIKNELYTMSNKLLKINNLDTLDNTNTISLNGQVYYPPSIPLPKPIDILE